MPAIIILCRAWFDHEWGTSALSEADRGWDWFTLSIARGPLKGADIMLCLIRKQDGSPNGFGYGSISFPDGRVEILTEREFSISPKASWSSPDTGMTYPASWEIAIPGHNLKLDAKPVVLDQEHKSGLAYYEGAIDIRDVAGDRLGRGYVEMTGY